MQGLPKKCNKCANMTTDIMQDDWVVIERGFLCYVFCGPRCAIEYLTQVQKVN